MMTVTPVWMGPRLTPSSSMSVVKPTRTPGTSVMASLGPVGRLPMMIPSSRARILIPPLVPCACVQTPHRLRHRCLGLVTLRRREHHPVRVLPLPQVDEVIDARHDEDGGTDAYIGERLLCKDYHASCQSDNRPERPQRHLVWPDQALLREAAYQGR